MTTEQDGPSYDGECHATNGFPTLTTADTPLVLTLALATSTALLLVLQLQQWHVWYRVRLLWEWLCFPVPLLEVSLTDAEARDDGVVLAAGDPAGDGYKNNDNNGDNTARREAHHHPSSLLRDPQHPDRIRCFDPSTGQFLGTVPAMTPLQVHEACAKAAAAQKDWARTSFAQRRRVLRTIQRYLVHHVRDVCRVSSRDSGKPLVDALLGEVLTTCEKIRCINAWGELWLRPSFRPTGPLMMHKSAWVEYVPLGVIAPIAPWNYPFHNMMNHIISGIFAGNAVVGKVSEHTAWSSQYFTRIVQHALRVHGHNPDLCQTITGFAEAGEALVKDPLVDKIIFTGSPTIGQRVMQTAAQHLKPVILELGGKDPMVITEQVHLKDVLPFVLRGCYQNCGQNCVGVERVLVYEAIYDRFLQAVLPLVQQLRQGVPLQTCPTHTADIDCGSMVMKEQLLIIQSLVDDAVQKGARILVGGKLDDSQQTKPPNSQFYPPTIIADVTPEMRIFHEELFGPVMTVVRVPRNDDKLCLDMVNSSQFGLGSSVYCLDRKRGLSIGQQIRSGMCCINDFGSNYLVQALPFGGVKHSGFGRFAGPEGLQALCLERSMLMDRIPGVQTTIPPPLQYPIDKVRGYGFAEALIQLFYNESILSKLFAIVNLIKYG